jgi:hypothetical protein
MENNELHNNIKGWNSDANPANEPTYPIKKYTGDDHRRLNYRRPQLQRESAEVLHSNERPGLTAVFGTGQPPAGLSGAIRRYAFRYSEGSFGHWLPLILADRIQMVEGLIQDIGNGHFPDFYRERGYPAEWKYNRMAMIRKGLIYAAIGAAVIFTVTKARKRKHR